MFIVILHPLFANFHLEQRKSKWKGAIHEQNGENQTRTEQYLNGTERAKISMLPMPARQKSYSLKHALEFKHKSW